ncbi:MAG: dynamin family protein [Desulfobacterales bacterium]
MDRYRDYKKELLIINRGLEALLSSGVSIPGMPKSAFEDWRRSCQTLKRQLSEETLRIAVVGAIKSGKSTFLNALLGGDYLKRGAGVVTSIVTRIRGGKHPRARLIFKSWSEANREIVAALALIPAGNELADKEQFDIRDSERRAALRSLLDSLPVEQQVSQGARNLNTALLTCYLSGYDRIRDFVSTENAERILEDGDWHDHWRFVSDDALAVYLKDLQLELVSRNLDSDTEFADCQGSDSPNPLHLAMIQDYLQQAHLIIYVISSRTGVREADIKFLSIIRKMGLIENLLFVVNTDISEHESVNDLKTLAGRVSGELGLIASAPELYTFSALYRLFGEIRESLNEKDQLRLAQWDKQREIVDFSKVEQQRFNKDLEQRLVRKRYQLMLKSQIERHGVILAGVSDWIGINREVLSRSDGDARLIADGIALQQERISQIKTVVAATIAGTVPKIKKELTTDVNRFFEFPSGACASQTIGFVRDYRVDFTHFENSLQENGFLNTLYLVFQEFKLALDTTMTNVVYPEIVQFVRREEEKIQHHMTSIFQPYEGIVGQGLSELRSVLNGFDINRRPDRHFSPQDLPSVAAVKESAALKLPPLVAFLGYSTQIKTEAFISLGYFSVARFFKSVFKRKDTGHKGSHVKALQKSVRRMKRLTEDSLQFQFKDYRENLKFTYLFRLLEEVAQRLVETLTDRFQAYGGDTTDISAHFDRQLSDRQRIASLIEEMQVTAGDIDDMMSRLRQAVENNQA